jgi:hypothetical protein
MVVDVRKPLKKFVPHLLRVPPKSTGSIWNTDQTACRQDFLQLTGAQPRALWSGGNLLTRTRWAGSPAASQMPPRSGSSFENSRGAEWSQRAAINSAMSSR